MTAEHRFGGQWTEEKLARLRKHLHAYMMIFSKNPRAAMLKTTYVDAFAGTGYRIASKNSPSIDLPLFEDTEAALFQSGSARIALETEPPLGQYLFIDSAPAHILEIRNLKEQFSDRASRVVIAEEEANSFLIEWCRRTDWAMNRAVVSLDPYGMEVEWKTVEALGQTKSVDLWLLLPLGQAVNRLLMRNRPPRGSWAARLTRCFGTDEWQSAFYRTEREQTLFGPVEALVKDADFEAIGEFFVKRLETVFAKVARKPLALRNSKGVPIYLLCFAAANPKGAPTAVKIANRILGR